MVKLEYMLVVMGLAAYCLGTGFAVRAGTRRLAGPAVIAGMLLSLAALIIRTVVSGHAPMANQYESLLFTAFGAGAITAYLHVRGRRSLVPALMPLLAVLQLVTLLFYAEPAPLAPVLRSRWLAVHVSVIMLGYSSLFLAFGCALLFIIAVQAPRLPLVRSLDDPAVLEQAAYRLVTVGYPLLVAGILTGAVWAKQAWGRYWGWDPKETWALVTWLAYTAYLHVRLRGRGSALRAALVNVAAFGCVVFTYFGVNYLLAGLHSYAK